MNQRNLINSSVFITYHSTVPMRVPANSHVSTCRHFPPWIIRGRSGASPHRVICCCFIGCVWLGSFVPYRPIMPTLLTICTSPLGHSDNTMDEALSITSHRNSLLQTDATSRIPFLIDSLHCCPHLPVYPVSLIVSDQHGKEEALLTESMITAFAPCLRLCLSAKNTSPCRTVAYSPTDGEMTGDEIPPAKTVCAFSAAMCVASTDRSL